MIIETRTEFPDFVGFVSGVDLKKDLDKKIVKEIDNAINKLTVLVFRNQSYLNL